MKFREFQHQPVKPDTYEASMALNQLMRIGKHAIKLHNMIDDAAEMESWVAKKIDLAGDYVKKVYNYTEGEKAGLYDDGGMTEDAGDQDDWTKLLNAVAQRYGKEKARVIHDYVQYGTDSGPELMKDYGLTPGDGMEENQREWFKKFPWLQKLDKTSWMDRLINIAGEGPEYGGAEYKYPKGLESVSEDAGDKFFDYENSDEYADNVEKYGDVDKTPLTPMERQQFAKWLMDSANDYAGRALEDGVEEIGADLSDIEDQYHKFIPKIKQYLKQSHAKGNLENFASDVLNVEEKFGDEDMLMNDEGYRVAKDFSQHAMNYEAGLSKLKSKGQDYTVKTIRGVLDLIDDDPHISSAMLVFQTDFEGTPLQRKVSRVQASESVSEDAGDQEKMQGLLQWFKNKYDTYRKDFIDDQIENGIRGSQLEQAVENNDELVELENIIDALKSGSMKDAIEEINRAKYEFSGIPGDGDDFMQVIEKLGIPKDTFYFTKDESLEARLEAKLSDDAGDMDLIGDGAENLGLDPNKFDYYYDTSGAGYGEVRTKSGKSILQFEYDRDGDAEVSTMDNKTIANIKQGEQLPNNVTAKLNMIKEDAGEGHMSKSTLYHTAKYAIELMDMIKPGDDLEGWVQSKLNKAADYLQGVYNYEEYQKLNPYREELDSNVLSRHAQVVQKNIDEILEKETEVDDIDTKPGMMRILAKRVNEVEKEMAKENRKNTDEAHGGQHTTSGRSMTKGEMNKREKIVKGMKKNKAGFKKRYGKDAEAVMYATATKNAMKDDEANESGILYRAGVKKYGKAGMKAIQSAAAKGANHQEIGKIKDKHLKDDEQMEEGLKDWAKGLAMAGIIVAGLAGAGSIQDAIDRSVPAVQAMETALEMANDAGNDELAAMIEKDLSAVKVRLTSGKDLGFVKDMQDKYSKFVKTEGLAYESKLALNLNQRLK